METEIELNTTFNATEEYEFPQEPLAWYEFIIPFTAFMGCIASTFIVCIIYKNKSLHVRPYCSIACYSLYNALYLLLCPIVFELRSRISKHLPSVLVCIGADSVFTAWVGTLVSLLLLLLEWYIPVHCSRPCSSKYVRFSKFISLSAATFTIALLTVGVITCAHGLYFPISILLALFVYFIVFIVILILIIIHYIKVKTMDVVAIESNVVLCIAVAYFVSWIGHYIMIWSFFLNRNRRLHPAWFIFANCLSFLCPEITLWVLYKYDVKFRKCVLKCLDKDDFDNNLDRVEVKSDQNQFQNLI